MNNLIKMLLWKDDLIGDLNISKIQSYYINKLILASVFHNWILVEDFMKQVLHTYNSRENIKAYWRKNDFN